MAGVHKAAMKRLMSDLDELKKSPVANMSAIPLEENMFEWHCNIRQDDTIFHLILFFPDNYPYSSPSAEFVPTGFSYNSGATMPGKKGTKVCLNIFSDFAMYHTEWANQKGLGWSPGYTVQMVLMNVIAFLAETQSSGSNVALSKLFRCSDCGHTYKKPIPSLDEEESETKSDKSSGKKGKGKGVGKNSKAKAAASTESVENAYQIIDYISKESFRPKKPESTEDLYGYGLVVSGPSHRPALTTPCEFLTGRSFYGMKSSVNIVHSVLKDELSFFLPLYIHPNHGSEIKVEFEKSLMKVAEIMPKCNPKKTPITEMIIKTIPNLMSATVVEFSKGTQHTSDNSLNGYFALHRLLLWALETYKDLQGEVESRLESFIKSEDNRTKKKCPHIGELLMLLAASSKYKWQDLANAYLSESWRRNVMWYVKEDSKLGFLDTSQDYRIKQTIERTAVSRKLLAFQVLFLDIAIPKGMSRKDIIKRYDGNLGFPTEVMVTQMKAACHKINNEMKTYDDFFKVLTLPAPSEDEVYTRLVEAVRFAILTDGYHWSFWKTGGGWGEVLRKYADMKKVHKEAIGTSKVKEEKAENPGKGDKKEEAMEVNDDDDNKKGKGKKTARRGASKSVSRGKSSIGDSVTRGRKRKAAQVADVESEESEEEEEEDHKPAAKAGRGRGRGRGRGTAAMNKKRKK